MGFDIRPFVDDLMSLLFTLRINVLLAVPDVWLL